MAASVELLEERVLRRFDLLAPTVTKTSEAKTHQRNSERFGNYIREALSSFDIIECVTLNNRPSSSRPI